MGTHVGEKWPVKVLFIIRIETIDLELSLGTKQECEMLQYNVTPMPSRTRSKETSENQA